MARARGGRSLAPMTSPALIPLRAAQALLALMGAVVTFGSIYFSVVEPTQSLGAIDWAVGAWALAMAIGMLAAAPRLRDPAVRRLALVLLALHFVFGAVKVVGYAESEAATFMLADLVLIGLIARLGRG
jgi:hypothetical protein